MGWSVALTGLVIFSFSVFMFSACQKHKRQPMVKFWAYVALPSLLSIPIGLIIQIWQ